MNVYEPKKVNIVNTGLNVKKPVVKKPIIKKDDPIKDVKND